MCWLLFDSQKMLLWEFHEENVHDTLYHFLGTSTLGQIKLYLLYYYIIWCSVSFSLLLFRFDVASFLSYRVAHFGDLVRFFAFIFYCLPLNHHLLVLFLLLLVLVKIFGLFTFGKSFLNINFLTNIPNLVSIPNGDGWEWTSTMYRFCK